MTPMLGQATTTRSTPPPRVPAQATRATTSSASRLLLLVPMTRFISKRRAAILAAWFSAGAVQVASAASLLETLNNKVCAVYDKSKDAIIKVHAQRQIQLGNLPLVPQHSVGTGFF